MIRRKTYNARVCEVNNRLRELTDEIRDLERTLSHRRSPTLALPLVDTAGMQVLAPSKYMPRSMARKWENVPLNKVIIALEALLEVTICYSQNEQKVVIYERDET